MATPTPPPAPAPTPTPSPWTDPATYLHLIALVLSTLFATGTIPSTGTAETIAVILASVLTSLGYPVTRAIAQRARQQTQTNDTMAAMAHYVAVMTAARASSTTANGGTP